MLFSKLAGKRFIHHTFLLVIPATTFSINNTVFPFTEATQNSVRLTAVHDTTGTLSPDSLTAQPLAAVVPLNRHATGFVNSFVKKEEEFLLKMKERSRQYFRTIEKLFVQQGLPPQLKYLAIVESQLRPAVTSPAGARGLWQLMPATARELGLTINGKTDERLHTGRSTAAAAKYLRNLHREFGDWLLALAAYNSGPGPVYAAIKKAGTRNYWGLQRFLPAESRGHVKRFIGVHYFFEGGGSIATQTKAEARAWQEKLCAEELAVR